MMNSSSQETVPRPSITNSAARKMAFSSFIVAMFLAVMSGTVFFSVSDAIIIAFLTNAVAMLGVPTIRNMNEYRVDKWGDGN